MNTLRYPAAALLLLFGLVATDTVRADPMKCSGQESTCRQACAQQAKGALSPCLTTCGARRSACVRTGCWDDGRVRYCGLAKQ